MHDSCSIEQPWPQPGQETVNSEHLYEELKRLRRENVILREERDILVKAAAYFAQHAT